MEILGFEVPLWTILLTVFGIWLYKFLYSGFDVFAKRGIRTVKPIYPFVGNLWGIWKKDIRKWQEENVRRYGKFFGFYDGKTPLLYVSDPEVIKEIFVKKFDCFADHKLFSFGLDQNKYIRKFLFVINGEGWKEARSAVTPAFSSGKIKKMSSIMVECCDRMVESSRSVTKGSGIIELKDFFGKVTLDVIARCAFGTKLDNLDDPNNPFAVNSAKAFRPSLFDSGWSLIPELFPWTQIFGLEALISRDSIEFFVKTVEEVIKSRKADGSIGKRGDFLDVLLEEAEAEKANRAKDPNAKIVLDEEVLISQCVTFFAAGYDTVGTQLAMAGHYLALYPECQEKLHEELKIERGCTKSCEIKGLKFERGDTVVFPMWTIHHTEEYHPDPNTFDPERFAPENKSKLVPYTYFPFGQGPRICIGMRFASEQSKLSLGHLILSFKLSRCSKTSHPPKYEGNRIISMPKDLFVKIEERVEE
ncbi:unnamed protein product [Notodromas monacha]|uniref:Cytochrome P450 n=1 Tax=Notodromas monacha TaxID=399045 RepID=A0A7R9C1J1_9CRUS|nr:unnamed protein product [Notodromas monacha]CAG0924400.1 unnamed protein product [Notodromas monacha]